MKTIVEMIEVMKSFEEKGAVGYRHKDWIEGVWTVTENPVWNWDSYDYRAIKEPKYRPYNNTEEMIDDFCERFGVKKTGYGLPFIWIKEKFDYTISLVLNLHKDKVSTTFGEMNMECILGYYTYLDGSPIGKMKLEQ